MQRQSLAGPQVLGSTQYTTIAVLHFYIPQKEDVEDGSPGIPDWTYLPPPESESLGTDDRKSRNA